MMHWQFRTSVREASPTAAHRALAAFEQRLPAECHAGPADELVPRLFA